MRINLIELMSEIDLNSKSDISAVRSNAVFDRLLGDASCLG
ncbi:MULTISPECIES: hypothetical protein [unclassified Microcoleus]|nr:MULTISPECIES: hypothetical protein [unclassified Microcoleus]